MTNIELHSPASHIEQSCVDVLNRLSQSGIGNNSWFSLPRSQKYEKLNQVIGNTPLETIPQITDGIVLAKQERDNPSGSHYDRAYLATLEYLEESGSIKPGDELRDISSGSAGISLALLGHLLGYSARITVPDELPPSRIFPMQFFGAEVVKSGPGYIRRTSEFQRAEIKKHLASGWHRNRSADPDMRAIMLELDNQRICYLNHSENLLSPVAFRAVGRELIRQIVKPPQAIVLAMGNWTTIAGISPVIRAVWPDTEIIGFEGQNTEVHNNYGTTVRGIPLRFRNENLLDSQTKVSDKERNCMDDHINSNLSPEQQIGHTSLMGLVVAEKIVTACPGSIVGTIIYDQKIRY
jgi:cysteine synthase A